VVFPESAPAEFSLSQHLVLLTDLAFKQSNWMLILLV